MRFCLPALLGALTFGTAASAQTDYSCDVISSCRDQDCQSWDAFIEANRSNDLQTLDFEVRAGKVRAQLIGEFSSADGTTTLFRYSDSHPLRPFVAVLAEVEGQNPRIDFEIPAADFTQRITTSCTQVEASQ